MVVLLSVPFTGTHFMRATLDWLGVQYENFHPGHLDEEGWGRGNPGSLVPDGVKVAPLRDPLLTWMSYIQRTGVPDWQRRLERGYSFGYGSRFGRDGNVRCWEWLFEKDIAAFVRIDDSKANHANDLRDLIRVTGADTPDDFDDYVVRWKKVRSFGNDHPLKVAYYARDYDILKFIIEQVKPILPEFRKRGCKFWWDDGS